MGKNKKNKTQNYDIEKLKREVNKNATVQIAEEYNQNNMAIFGANINLKRHILQLSDGLKPVYRRILMTMYKEKLYHGKTAKSATVTGNVLAYYHPHGEQAVYKTLAYLAQEWRNNVVLVNGKGNFGSAFNPDAYAHQRYTNCGLSEFAYDCFFSEWKFTNPSEDMTVDWIPTYDESDLEPMYLPAKYPLFLLQWHRSMGVGRFTCTPGFNIIDAFEAVIKLIKDPDAKFDIYPDDPKGCTLINRDDIHGILDKEFVKLRFRATYEIEHFKGKDIIEIKSVPFEVVPETVINAIRRLADKGELPEISDIGGSSEDENGVGDGFSISIEMKKGYDAEAVMLKLYKKTQLEETYVTKYAFVDGLQSVDYTLRIAILEWLRYRRETLKRIYKIKRLNVLKRIHFLIPLIKVLESGEIDEFVNIVRKNKKKDIIPKLMKKFDLTDYQAEKISDVKLSALSLDSLNSYKNELSELSLEDERLEEITRDKKAIDKIIIDQLKEGIKKYGKPRNSKITQLIDSVKIPNTLHYLIFTDKYVKKLPYSDDGYRVGRVDSGEKIRKVISVNNRDKIVIFTRDGRAVPVEVNDIGNSSLQSVGISLSQIGTRDNFIDVIKVGDDLLDKYIVSVTEKGLITKTPTDDLFDKNKSMSFMKLSKDDFMVGIGICDEHDDFLVYTKNGYGAKFGFGDFETTARNTKGCQSIKLDDGDEVMNVCVISNDDTHIVVMTDRGHMKRFAIRYIPKTKRNSGSIEINSNGTIATVIAVNDNDDHLYAYTSIGAFELDPFNIKSTTRLGKNQRVIELKGSEYAFDLR